MKQSGSAKGRSVYDLIDPKIAARADWRGAASRRMRPLAKEADPGLVEGWKQIGTPVSSHDAVCQRRLARHACRR